MERKKRYLLKKDTTKALNGNREVKKIRQCRHLQSPILLLDRSVEQKRIGKSKRLLPTTSTWGEKAHLATSRCLGTTHEMKKMSIA